MVDAVNLRGVRVGEGRAKVAVSLTSPAAPALRDEAARLAVAPVDVAEWRGDLFDRHDDAGAVLAALAAIRAALGEVPLVVTLRSVAEGGRADVTDAAYAALTETVLASGHADAVDLELGRPPALLAPLVHAARARGVAVLASSHDLAGTPPAAEIVARLARMADLGADLLKVAVTPREPRDVLTLLDATLTASGRLGPPVITIAMGAAGVVSRLGGQIFGSALTFGALDRASAPGQVDVALLAPVVGLVHRYLADAATEGEAR
ncbi:type I 3-dehydroquinate dehydratase [Georgenia sp. MJ206]|uniref:type I 3-dehydroquinate dehydratase n=1 Tax=Georgenia wangjunii TaxID=3117730 RepID=UPI002F26AC9B